MLSQKLFITRSMKTFHLSSELPGDSGRIRKGSFGFLCIRNCYNSLTVHQICQPLKKKSVLKIIIETVLERILGQLFPNCGSQPDVRWVPMLLVAPQCLLRQFQRLLPDCTRLTTHPIGTFWNGRPDPKLILSRPQGCAICNAA